MITYKYVYEVKSGDQDDYTQPERKTKTRLYAYCCLKTKIT